jgi:hypothetical protein
MYKEEELAQDQQLTSAVGLFSSSDTSKKQNK